MAPTSYFTVTFQMGQVVVQTDASGGVVAVTFDLDGRYGQRRTNSKLGNDLRKYFMGDRVMWDLDLIVLDGLTEFKRRVYERVAAIPYGQTLSYGEVAEEVGSPGAARAVGQAMASNRFPLLVPCHRVISGTGGIGGFSSGTALKRFLLDLEGVEL